MFEIIVQCGADQRRVTQSFWTYEQFLECLAKYGDLAKVSRSIEPAALFARLGKDANG